MRVHVYPQCARGRPLQVRKLSALVASVLRTWSLRLYSQHLWHCSLHLRALELVAATATAPRWTWWPGVFSWVVGMQQQPATWQLHICLCRMEPSPRNRAVFSSRRRGQHLDLESPHP